MELLENTLVEEDTLLTITRARLMDGVLRSVKTPLKILVLDKISTKVISAALDMTHLTQCGISLIENLEISRQPLPRMDALYFVTPTAKVVDLIIKDWEDPDSPPYANAHLFFTSHLEDRLVDKLSNSPANPKIKTLSEVNIDFLTTERRVFSFNMPEAFHELYSPSSSNPKKTQTLIAAKLITVCSALGEYPIVRYSKSHPHCAIIAQLVADGLDELRRAGLLDATGERAQLVVTDRSHDLLSPLIHDLTYQAMCTDLLDVSQKYKHEFKTSSGEEVEKDVFLDEHDPIWLTMAHMHIEYARKWVASTVKDFLAKSKAAQVKTGASAEDKSMKNISEVMKSMPKFQKLYSKFSLHVTLAKKCMDEFSSRGLEKLCAAEQDVGTGTTDSGKKLDNGQLADTVLSAISGGEVSKEDRLRLILLYMASLDKDDPKTKKLMTNARLTAEEEEIVANLALLKNATSRKIQRRAPGKDEWEFMLSRYFPSVKDIYEDLYAGKLSAKDFPFVNPDDENNAPASATPSAAKSKRKTDASTASKWGGGGGGGTPKQRDGAKRPARLIVFVAGGVSYPELREAYIAAKHHKVDCIIGGTAIIKPREFVDAIAKLKDSGADEDERRPAAASSGKKRGGRRAADSDEEEDEPVSPRRAAKQAKKTGAKVAPKAKTAKKVKNDSEDEDSDSEEAPKVKKSGNGAKPSKSSSARPSAPKAAVRRRHSSDSD